MKFKLTFIIFFSALHCFGQHGKTVIIDKLVSKLDTLRLKNMLVSLDKNRILESENIIVQFDVDNKSRVVVSHIESDSFHLLLDNKGGYCNVYAPNIDTVHIRKWVVYQNGLSDITVGSIRYDRMDGGPQNYSQPFSSQTKNVGTKKLKSISIQVNGQRFKNEVSNIYDTTIRHFQSSPEHKIPESPEWKISKRKSNVPSGEYFIGEAKDISVLYFTRLRL